MTENHQVALLNDRTLVTVGGPDAGHFLQNLITTDISRAGNIVSDRGGMLPGALLSPQGKVLFDFLIGMRDRLFFIDLRRDSADAFISRLHLYRLRADIKIDKENQNLVHIFRHSPHSTATFSDHNSENKNNILIFKDKRINRKYDIIRVYEFKNQEQITEIKREKWDIIRIAHGLAESGSDFESGDVFPHDINYDQINGLSFQKGCYIGQEVVSRMQHRGTARRRVLVAAGTGPLPCAGTVIEAAGKPLGTLGTVIGARAIALARIDRVTTMIDAGCTIMAGGIPLTLSPPEGVNFSLSDQTQQG